MYVLRTSAIAPIVAITSMTTTSLKSCFRASMTKIESISKLNKYRAVPNDSVCYGAGGNGNLCSRRKIPVYVIFAKIRT